MNVLITGGAGFVGSHFVRAVLADRLPGLEGATVTVLDTMGYASSFASLGPVAEDKRLDFVPADVRDAPVVDAAVRHHDAVVHFADTAGGPDQAAVNVAGTQVLLDAAVRHGVTRYLQISTGEVYGSIETGAATEQTRLAPTTAHAATRAGADLLALAYHHSHGLPVVVTRGCPTYGPRQHPARLIPRIVTTLLDGGMVYLPGEGARIRDWLHVDDHCHAAALALLDGRPGETYHIGGTVELSDRDLAGVLLNECGAGWDRVIPTPADPTSGQRQALDDDKIRRDLGWRPKVEFDTGIAATVRWYRGNPTWWRPLLD
jgi:dTDP-glucose 4,6-dehydratase